MPFSTPKELFENKVVWKSALWGLKFEFGYTSCEIELRVKKGKY